MKNQVVIIIILSWLTMTVHAQQKPVKTGVFHDCADCPAMVVVPGGSFTMGSPETEQGRAATEGPATIVQVKSFAVGIFTVTRGEWAAFAKATGRMITGGCAFSGFKDSTRKDWEANPQASWAQVGFPQTDQHPVVCITWEDARAYVQWLSQKTGKDYRLLSEAEWEYAARAGTTSAYPWGDTPGHDYANYGADSGWTGFAGGRDQWMGTSPVGSFPPNKFGLYDMHGNVLQYLEDYFSPSYDSLPKDGRPYKTSVTLTTSGKFKYLNGTNSADWRMVRGGDWGDPPFMIRSAFRNWVPGRGFKLQNYRSGGVGFRVARSI